MWIYFDVTSFTYYKSFLIISIFYVTVYMYIVMPLPVTCISCAFFYFHMLLSLRPTTFLLTDLLMQLIASHADAFLKVNTFLGFLVNKNFQLTCALERPN